MAIKVHPGIGVARVGTGPHFYVGPEDPDARVLPSGGYRDEDCLIRRQAAIFRVFEHLADGSVRELHGDPTVTITWHVRATTGATWTRGSAGPFFAGPEVPVSAAVGASQLIPSTGTAQLEAQLDAQGRLIVMAPALTTPTVSWDGRCEGSVRAVVVRAGATSESSSWIVVYPPDFAPGLPPGNVGEGLRTRLWPALPAAPATQTDRLDRAALRWISGWDGSASFGGLNAADFLEPFRFLPSGPPQSLRNPYDAWHTDIQSCTWIDSVGVPDRSDPPLGWFPTRALGENWRIRGFTETNADGRLIYVDWCPVITAPSSIPFFQVQRGSEGTFRLRVRVRNFPEVTPITWESSSPTVRLEWGSLTLTPWSVPRVEEASDIDIDLWAFFRAAVDAPLGVVTATVQVHFGTAHTLQLTARAEIVEPRQSALALVLDCSASMEEPTSTGPTRIQSLKRALGVLVDIAPPGLAVAVAPFSGEALATMAGRPLGSGDAADESPGGARHALRQFVEGLVTVNSTSIGAGLLSGRTLLSRLPTYTNQALIVVTDGYENRRPFIEEVEASITNRTFSLGIGTAFEPALRQIAHRSDAFITIYSDPTSGADRYDLEKYLLQIFAGATTDDTLVDPEGVAEPGEVDRYPFVVSEAEQALHLVVVADQAPYLLVGLQGPSGEVVSLEALQAQPHCRVRRSGRVASVSLPVPLSTPLGATWGPGRWAILVGNPGGTATDPKSKELLAQLQKGRSHGMKTLGKPIPYLCMVNTSSALRFRTTTMPTAKGLRLEASLDYGGAPILSDTKVTAEVLLRSGTQTSITLQELTPGHFQAELALTRKGSFRIQFNARGRTQGGHRFQRERVVTELLQGNEATRGKEKLSHESKWRAQLQAIADSVKKTLGRPPQDGPAPATSKKP